VTSKDVGPLFSGQALTEYIEQKKLTIKEEVERQTARHRRSSFAIIKDRTKLREEGAIPVPEIVSKEARVQGDEVEYVIRFEGSNGTFFRLRPHESPDGECPVGVVYSSSLSFYVSNSDDATSIKAELARRYENFNSWYTALRAEAEAFNQALPGYIDQIFTEHEEAERKAKALEDEINS
jgi:hypothetical protein